MFFCSLENTNSASNLFSLFFCCCFAADEPVLRDNEALRSKCLVPMVSFMSLPCCLFLQLATGSLIRSLMLCFDNAHSMSYTVIWSNLRLFDFSRSWALHSCGTEGVCGIVAMITWAPWLDRASGSIRMDQQLWKFNYCNYVINCWV